MAVLKIHTAEPTPLREVNGVVYVGQTRVPIDTVIGAYLDGADADQIVRAYDTLELADVHAVISYYLRHREEVEAYLQQGRQEAAEIRRENQTRFPTARLRERLLARQNQAKLSL
jgi:uncharacterized protein (DUF433 family)